MVTVEQVTAPVAGHGEGPCWFADDNRMRWVDMLVGDVLELDPTTGAVERRHVAGLVAALRPRRGGGTVLAVERGFAVLDPGAEHPLLLPEVWSADAGLRMNDGACDALGRFYCGALVTAPPAHRGTLQRLDPDGTVHQVLEGVDISNGLAWNRTGDTAWYTDSATSRIDVFSVDAAGDLVERRPFVAIDPALGYPDGLCLDSEGGVWVALWDGGAVHRYDSEGRLDEIIRVPVDRPTACAFGGPELDQLYITTSRPENDESSAGSLFVAVPGVSGFADYQFAG